MFQALPLALLHFVAASLQTPQVGHEVGLVS